MKYNHLCIALLVCALGNAQSLVQSVNSGSLISANTAASIGEIVVNPVNPAQGSSGLIGILANFNNPLEVGEFEVATDIVAYPNPTTASIAFKGRQDLAGMKVSVYSDSGQLVLKQAINRSNGIDLSQLAAGIYVIRFDNSKNKSFKIIKH